MKGPIRVKYFRYQGDRTKKVTTVFSKWICHKHTKKGRTPAVTIYPIPKEWESSRIWDIYEQVNVIVKMSQKFLQMNLQIGDRTPPTGGSELHIMFGLEDTGSGLNMENMEYIN